MAFAARSFVLLACLLTATNALNDWSKPCLEGSCSYDLPDSDGQAASGSVKIWSDNKALITDITQAADWEIMGCSPDKLAQDIRIVCKSEDSEKCNHLLDGGAEGKVVRLPENCGQNAFGRIGRAWISEDQTVPQDIARRLVRRAGAPPQVRGVAIDTDFAAIDTSKGTINFALRGANFQGAKGDIDVGQSSDARRRDLTRRIDIIGGAVDLAKDAGNAVADAGSAVVDAGGAAIDAGKSAVNAVVDNKIDVSQSQTLPPLAINKKFNLLNQKVTCPGRSAGLTVDMNANAQVVVTVAVAAAGTIAPPKFTDFVLTTTMNGEINSSIDLKASVSGTLDSGKKQIAPPIGVPGFSIPGIITVGPAFKIDGQALATLDLNVDVNVGVSYKIDNVQAIFPPKNGDKVGTFSIGDTPLKLSASPSVAARGEVEAHIIPALTFGIDAIGGAAKADAFINLDASAHAVLTLNANAEASATVNTTSGKKRAGPARVARIDSRQVQTTASAGFGGCFDTFAQLDVNAGVEGSLFGIFDVGKDFNLFTKKFDLFKKCFGNQARALPGLLMERRTYATINSHRRMSKVSRALRHLEGRALGCPKAGVTDVASVVDSANAVAAAR
ncbi:hypothetical protein DL96DRAFT_1685532 [Flagelloscypha sp. PMI_526]|nr:hypothetical protein DL96DRAFT_1685532 [Flagelloscypha sp. PMI_526]